MPSAWLKCCDWVNQSLRSSRVYPLSLQSFRAGFEDEDEGTGARPPRDPLRSEIRRRTFWACFLLDRTVSDGKERPSSLKPPLGSTLRMPGSDAEFQSSRPSHGARFEVDPPAWSISVKMETSARDPEVDLYGLVSAWLLWRFTGRGH